jgi:hypothetical protein
MSQVTPGSGATLKADSLEGQLLELASFLKKAEQTPAQNPNARNFIGITCNFSTLVASITFSLPASPGINSSGQLITTATPYLQNTGFTAGSGGTFLSPTPEGYFLELIVSLQISEANSAKNPTLVNNISAIYDTDEQLFDGTAALPFVFSSQTDGSVALVPEEYLLD